MVDVIVRNKYNGSLTGVTAGTTIAFDNKQYVLGRIKKTGILTPVDNPKDDVLTFQIGATTLGEALSRFMSFSLNKKAHVIPVEDTNLVIGNKIEEKQAEEKKVKKAVIPAKKDSTINNQEYIKINSILDSKVTYIVSKEHPSHYYAESSDGLVNATFSMNKLAKDFINAHPKGEHTSSFAFKKDKSENDSETYARYTIMTMEYQAYKQALDDCDKQEEEYQQRKELQGEIAHYNKMMHNDSSKKSEPKKPWYKKLLTFL